MRAWTLLLVTALKACDSSGSGAVEGAWQSNRDLTLAELRQAQSFTPEQWRALSDPTLFGHMVQVFDGNAAIAVFEGECSEPRSFSIDASQSGSVLVRVDGDGTEPAQTLVVKGDHLFVPIAMLKGSLRETFTRVSLDDVSRRYPCVREFVQK